MDWFDLLAVQETLKRCTKFTLKWFDGAGLMVDLFFCFTQDLSFQTRDRTRAPCSGSAES